MMNIYKDFKIHNHVEILKSKEYKVPMNDKEIKIIESKVNFLNSDSKLKAITNGEYQNGSVLRHILDYKELGLISFYEDYKLICKHYPDWLIKFFKELDECEKEQDSLVKEFAIARRYNDSITEEDIEKITEVSVFEHKEFPFLDFSSMEGIERGIEKNCYTDGEGYINGFFCCMVHKEMYHSTKLSCCNFFTLSFSESEPDLIKCYISVKGGFRGIDYINGLNLSKEEVTKILKKEISLDSLKLDLESVDYKVLITCLKIIDTSDMFFSKDDELVELKSKMLAPEDKLLSAIFNNTKDEWKKDIKHKFGLLSDFKELINYNSSDKQKEEMDKLLNESLGEVN